MSTLGNSRGIARQRLRQHSLGQPGRESGRHRAAQPGREILEFHLRLGHRLQDRQASLVEPPSGRGRVHATPRALEQRGSQPRFQRAHLLAYARGRAIQPRRRPR